MEYLCAYHTLYQQVEHGILVGEMCDLQNFPHILWVLQAAVEVVAKLMKI
jgi:hypothetical protein